MRLNEEWPRISVGKPEDAGRIGRLYLALYIENHRRFWLLMWLWDSNSVVFVEEYW